MKKTLIGGQALIEGVMMKGPDKIAMAVRKSDGSILTEVRDVPTPEKKSSILGLPVLRGIVNFFNMMKLGVSCISFSAAQMDMGDAEPDKFDLWVERKFGKEKGEKVVTNIAIVLGIAFPVLLFILLPTLLTGWLGSLVPNHFLRNLIEGAVRILIFLLFLFSVSRMKDMKRTFSYHGAEHKTIFAYEKGLELTVDNVRGQSRFHPRCGTSFLFVVMIISILVFSLFSWPNAVVRLILRLALLPVVVGISYEVNRLVGRYDNPLTVLLRSPGLALQKLTTNEPDDGMIETAIAALTPVIPQDGESDRW